MRFGSVIFLESHGEIIPDLAVVGDAAATTQVSIRDNQPWLDLDGKLGQMGNKNLACEGPLRLAFHGDVEALPGHQA